MKSVGQYLHQARLKKQLTLDQVARKTRIRPDYLKAIEAGKFSALPSATFVKGFIQSYAKTVSLNPSHALAIFRRDYDQNKRGKIIPRGLTNPLKTPSRFFNPRTTTILVATVSFFLISAYIIRQLFILTGGPTINLTSPENGDSTPPIVEIVGTTSPDATITVNQKPLSTKSDGSFQTTLDLAPGEHTIVIEATSRDNKTTTLTRTITVEEQ